jgi:uncharacterized membrane protein YdjX (TVP38/TMEM64 family)
MKRSSVLLLIVAGAVVVLVGAVLAFEWSGDFSTAGLEDTIRSLGAWGVLASIALMIVHSFVPFPAEFVALANGMVYGPLWGTVITWVGAMLGASIAFWLARRLGRPFVERMVSRNDWRVLDDWAAVNGWQVVLISRFIPVIAFNLINYAAGLTGLSWWRFIWTTGVGILPLTTLMVVMGDNVESLGWESWLALLIGGVALWFLLRQKLRTQQPTLTSGGKR